jgi:peptidoglycan/xylan/chitin deacetylase (PgdA/CDA1 family)
MSESLPVIWSNDDIGHGKARPLQVQLDFLDRFGIPGVFYVIPKLGGQDLDADVELCRLMEKARDRGHEFYQHGYVHTPFESGVPETWMLDFNPEVRSRYDADRLAIEATHTLARMVEKIEAGQRIWRRALGEASPGYRPGWGAFCGAMYQALDILGYEWVSSRICEQTSWLWNQGLWQETRQYRDAVPGSPWRMGRLVEYPIAGDYGFRVPHDENRIARMVELWVGEFEQFAQRGWPMNVVSHHHGLEWDGGSGYAVHAEALTRLQATGRAEFIGMVELHRRTLEKSGGAAGSATGEPLCL